jgi:hypothetical protein
MSPIQLTISNNTLNISINIADLVNKGNININLNNLLNAEQVQIPVAEATIIDDVKNVTIRRPTKKNIIEKRPKLLIVEEESESESELELEVEQKETKRKYISHKYERDQDGLIQCPYCDCKKRNLSTISMHVTTNHASEMGRESNPFKCEHPGCNKSFPVKTRLQHHINNHHKVENLDCPFDGCNYSDAKNKQTLYTHYVRKHMNYETMCNGNVCNTCNSTKPTGIIYHLATCHPSSPYCKTCI